MKKIGVTGGIGSGKTLVCQVFSTLGIPVYNADNQAKKLINTNTSLRNELIAHFGEETYNTNGYNTSFIAEKVFNNPGQLKKLNQIIHPHVHTNLEQWLRLQSNSSYVIYEAAILFESGGKAHVDAVIVVDAPKELRIKRIVERDKTNREAVEARIRNQWPADKKRTMADWVIENNDKQLILPQILNIHKEIIS